MIKKQHNNDLFQKNNNKSNVKSKLYEQETGSDTPKKNSFKVGFLQWLKQLPLDQRYLAVKVHAPGLSKKMQSTLIDFEHEIPQQQKKDPTITKKISPRQAKQIIESIVLISDGQQYFDNVGFDFSYIQQPDKLYQLLLINLSQQEKLMYLTEKVQLQEYDLQEVLSMVEKSQSKQEFSHVLISFLRAEIFKKYDEKKLINLQEERNRKKQFSMFWRNLSEQYKRKILLLNKNDFETLSTYLAERKVILSAADLEREISDLTQMEKNQFCNKIFKCKLKRSLTYFTDYHELVYKVWKNELNKKKRRCKNHKIINSEKPSTSLNRSSVIITSEKPPKRNQKNQKQLEKAQFIVQKDKLKQNISINSQNEKNVKNCSINQQNDKNIKQNSHTTNSLLVSQNEKNNKNNNVSTNTTSITGIQSTNPPTKRKRNRNNRRKKSTSAESKQTNTTSHKLQKSQKQEFQRKIEGQTHIGPQQIIQKLCSSVLLIQDLQPPATLKQFIQKSSQTQPRQIPFPKIDFQTYISERIRSDIQEYSDLINEEANQFYYRRVIAYERIQFILGMWKIPIKLFGSCASGITIKNSDIDIAVDNSILNYFMHLSQTNRLRGALQQLQQLLQQQPWVTGLRLIKTAAIPLIKLKVNTLVNFTQIPGFQIHPDYLDVLNREHASAGEIHIDLTIETINKELQCNHLGIISTDQINAWLKSIKCLHPIVIIIKNFLTKTNLNITYEGGLNTYSMICMFVAFIKHNKLQNQTDVVKVFKMLLKFYVYQFDEKTTGIDLLNEQNIFYDKFKIRTTKSATPTQEAKLPELVQSKSVPVFCQADLEIKDPLNNGKIMTKNCYSFPKIRQILEKTYKKCFQEPQTNLEAFFKQQFTKNYLNQQAPRQFQEDNEGVKNLLNECRNKLRNPLLTLFD